MTDAVVIRDRDRFAGVVHAAIVDAPIDVPLLIDRVQHRGIGALSLFLGTVRDLNDGRAVTGMDYEAYRPMAASELMAIARELCDEQRDLVIAIEHRIGTLDIGEVSVAIACAHPHRRQAIESASRAIESLKQRVPIWKREHYVEGDRAWVDPTHAAGASAARGA